MQRGIHKKCNKRNNWNIKWQMKNKLKIEFFLPKCISEINEKFINENNSLNEECVILFLEYKFNFVFYKTIQKVIEMLDCVENRLLINQKFIS